MSIISMLIRLARKVVEGVQSQLMGQLNIVQEQARAPMKAMVDAVVGGVWIGKGADAFVEEVSSLMMPGVGQIADQISIMHKNIQHAMDVIDRADEQVSSLVNGLADIFDGIF
ncbi:MAG: hypothetical protein Kow0031_21860 [Anaerolineae bacterium]